MERTRTNEASRLFLIVQPPLLLLRRGGRDIKKSSEASFDGADRVVWSRDSRTTPPRLHELMRLRDFSWSCSHPSSC